MSTGLGDLALLPVELLEEILLHLSPDDLLAVQQLSKAFQALISESVELQYTLALRTHGLIDGPSPVSKNVKLDEVRRKEKAWGTLDLSRKTTVRVGHLASHIYDLSGGVYLLGDAGPSRNMSRTARLGAFELDDVKEEEGVNVKERVEGRRAWRFLNIPDQIVDIGMCLQEYDLVGVIALRHKLSSSTNINFIGL